MDAAIAAEAERQRNLQPTDTETRPIGALDPNDYPEFKEVCEKWGYKFLPYEANTEDGWTLTLFRITGKVGGQARPTVRENEKPILIQHGMYTDASH